MMQVANIQIQTEPEMTVKNYIPGLVSVIIPTYNRSVFLEEAIQSILEQSYRPIECIVADGSTANLKKNK